MRRPIRARTAACSFVSFTSPLPVFSFVRRGIQATTHEGTCTIAITHEASSEMQSTRKRSRQYSPAVLLEI